MKGFVKSSLAWIVICIITLSAKLNIIEFSVFGTFMCCLSALAFGWGDSE